MNGLPSDVPLIGVTATPHRVEAQLVTDTGFGRLVTAGRKVVEGVDGPTGFLPLGLDVQLGTDGLAVQPMTTEETRAGEAWVETIANTIAKLTFGLRGVGIRVGVAVDGHLDADGRAITAARGGARVENLPGALEVALRGRNVALDQGIDRIASFGEAWALGELTSAMGGLVGLESALVLTWDDEVTWVDVRAGRVADRTIEAFGSPLDLGFTRLEELRAQACGEGDRLLSAARRGDQCVSEVFDRAAFPLGYEAGRRVALSLETEGELIERVVLGGALGRALLDPTFGIFTLHALRVGMGEAIQENSLAAAIEGEIMQREADDTEGRMVVAEGYVHVSREDAAAVIGAAAGALES